MESWLHGIIFHSNQWKILAKTNEIHNFPGLHPIKIHSNPIKSKFLSVIYIRFKPMKTTLFVVVSHWKLHENHIGTTIFYRFLHPFPTVALRHVSGLPDGAAAVVRPAERRHLATQGVGGALAPHGPLGFAAEMVSLWWEISGDNAYKWWVYGLQWIVMAICIQFMEIFGKWQLKNYDYVQLSLGYIRDSMG